VNVTVDARHDDEHDGGWRTHTLRYDLSLYDRPAGGNCWLAYHFHPNPTGSGYLRPHVHVGADAGSSILLQ